MLIFLTDVMKQVPGVGGTVYGTRHSFSYLIANARLLHKRKQHMDIIAQIQCGIRVFDLSLRLEKTAELLTTGGTLQKIWQTFRPFFRTKMYCYAGKSCRAFISTHHIRTDLLVRHALAILNQTARYCAIAKLIVVISFTCSKQSESLTEDELAQKAILTQIKADSFDHLFIVLASDLHQLFHHIIHEKNYPCFSSMPVYAGKQQENRLNRENAFIAELVDNFTQKKGQNKAKLIWISQFSPLN